MLLLLQRRLKYQYNLPFMVRQSTFTRVQLTFYFSKEQIKRLSSAVETKVLDDLGKKIH
jgi:hypothetical protein